MSRGWPSIRRAALCLGVLAVGGVAGAPPRDEPRATSGPAATVQAFARTMLASPVLALEDALATANRGLLAYCGVPELSLVTCADLATHQGPLTGTRLQA